MEERENEPVAMEEDQDYDEVLIYVEFTGIGVSDILNQENPEIKVIGLLENEPTVQLGGQVYAGELDLSWGTNVFFEETEDTPQDFDPDLNQAPDKWFKFDSMTQKELIVKRIYTKKKVTEDQ